MKQRLIDQHKINLMEIDGIKIHKNFFETLPEAEKPEASELSEEDLLMWSSKQ